MYFENLYFHTLDYILKGLSYTTYAQTALLTWIAWKQISVGNRIASNSELVVV